MKSLYALVLFVFSTAYVHSACFKHELKGRIKVKENKFTLVLADGTASELSLAIPQDTQHKAAPYIDKYVEGIFVLDTKTPGEGSIIIKTEKVRNSVYDPLNRNLANTRKKLGEAPCP